MNRKVNYEDTGKFTQKQETLAEEIAEKIKILRKTGCSVIAKADRLCVYKSKEIAKSQLVNPGEPYSYGHRIPYLNAGYINDSGADDEEYFIDSYILL